MGAEGDSIWKPTDDELKQILAAHRQWLDEGDKAGLKAYLAGAQLQGAFLSRAQLQGAILEGACGDKATKLPQGFTIAACTESSGESKLAPVPLYPLLP